VERTVELERLEMSTDCASFDEVEPIGSSRVT